MSLTNGSASVVPLDVLEEILDTHRQATESWAELTYLVRRYGEASDGECDALGRQLAEANNSILGYAERIRALAERYRDGEPSGE